MGVRGVVVSIPATALLFAFSFTSLVPVKFLIAILFLLYLPGFNVMEALYKWTPFLTSLQRFLASVGLSIGVTIITNYFLTYANILINLQSLVASLGGEALTLSMVQFALNRFNLLERK